MTQPPQTLDHQGTGFGLQFGIRSCSLLGLDQQRHSLTEVLGLHGELAGTEQDLRPIRISGMSPQVSRPGPRGLGVQAAFFQRHGGCLEFRGGIRGGRSRLCRITRSQPGIQQQHNEQQLQSEHTPQPAPWNAADDGGQPPGRIPQSQFGRFRIPVGRVCVTRHSSIPRQRNLFSRASKKRRKLVAYGSLVLIDSSSTPTFFSSSESSVSR